MHRCWQHFIPTLSVTYVFTHLLGLCIKKAVLSLKTPEVTGMLPILLLSQSCSSSLSLLFSKSKENKEGIQRLKKVLKNFYIHGVVSAAGSFKGRLWVMCDANPAQPGRRGIMEPPLCFWADKLRREVGVLVKCLGSQYRQHCWDWWWLGCQDLEVPFGTAFSSPCCSQPCAHHGHASRRASRIAHHIFCQGHGWQGMVGRETPCPPPPIELISYMSLCHFPSSIAFSKCSINLFIVCIKKKIKRNGKHCECRFCNLTHFLGLWEYLWKHPSYSESNTAPLLLGSSLLGNRFSLGGVSWTQMCLWIKFLSWGLLRLLSSQNTWTNWKASNLSLLVQVRKGKE